jgi:hypothetical protein
MDAIYSNGGNHWNIPGFNFTKRYALFSVYKISMLTPIGIREEKNRGTDRNLADFFHFARKNVPCKIATGGDQEGRGWRRRDWKRFRLGLNLRQPYIFLRFSTIILPISCF